MKVPYEIKKALQCCSAVGFETSCNFCPYCYRCNDLSKDALNIITEQEKEIEQLTRECNQQAETLAKEQEACVECELKQSWELFVRDKEIDRLRAESKRFENNMKSVHEIEKKNVVKEFAEKLKDYINDKVVEEFNDMAADVIYLTIDIDEFEDYVDELLREYEK